MSSFITTLATASSLGFPSVAPSPNFSWIPSEIMKIKSISEVRLSPRNDSVLVVATEAVMEREKNIYTSRIYRKNFNERDDLVPFTSSENSAKHPRWSPDGQWVAFLSNRDGTDHLYLIPTTGSEAIPLTEGKEKIQTFRWSPDGKQILFIMADPTESEKNEQIKRDTLIYKKDKKVNRLWLIDVFPEKSVPQPMTSDEYCVRGSGDFGFSNAEFDWSLDGQQVVFAYNQSSGLDHYHLDSQLALLDLKTKVITPLKSRASYEANPRFSPDGQWIAYVSSDGQARYTYDRFLVVRSLDGTSLRHLSPTNEEGCFLMGPNFLGWTADSHSVLFFEPKGTKFALTRLPIDGSAAQEISTKDCFFKQPVLSDDRTMLGFISESSSQPPEAFVAKLDDFSPTQISQFNQRFLSFPIPKTEIVHWKSADGQTIEGLLTYPLHYQEGKKYPLALIVHGGPMGFFYEHFIGSPSPYPYASFAESGCFVFRPNPRGSCGYGKTFRSANLYDWGGQDFSDIMAGVDMLIAQEKVDPNRMGIMGWSYGGYMTAWAITQTDRFKAASVGAGMTNCCSMVGTTDLHRLLTDYLGNFPDNHELYQTRSPIHYVQNVTTPCLIQHGLTDLRVPVSQAYEFYHALDRQNKSSLLLLYPDCAHYFEKPKVELEALQANLSWFTEHLFNLCPSNE